MVSRIIRRGLSSANPFHSSCAKKLDVPGPAQSYYSLAALGDSRLESLPYSIRVLLESAVRNCDEFAVTRADVEKILAWESAIGAKKEVEIPFKPARVLLQDFTGVPAVVDLAAMRDAMVRLGGDPSKINPLCPVDLVIDHSIQVDASRTPEALAQNEAKEYERNAGRFGFLKWGQNAFQNFQIVPPGSGIVHQVNLEYLARGVVANEGMLYPDSLVGTDSHTTMINGAGIVGWGVGGIEAESVMLGQHISMVLPPVVGFELTGRLPDSATATDLVLTAVNMLRELGVVGKFVEFFGSGVGSLSLADRATVANMAPEYGATIGYFPFDEVTIDYFRVTGRQPDKIATMEAYYRSNSLFRTGKAPNFSEKLTLDLSTIRPCVSGPKRPQDKVPLDAMKQDFTKSLTAPVGFKGFGLKDTTTTSKFNYKGQDYTLQNGSVVIAAITSCTNTSNPAVMLGAGLLAKKAVEAGLSIAPYIKTSLSPGSGVVTKYLELSNTLPYLNQLGFHLAGYGCMTCIGNSGDLDIEVAEAITKDDLVTGAVLSGNRNFEGRVHPLTRANYLASPPLVVAYALAGRLDIDFETEPIGQGNGGKDVFLRDVWPSNTELAEYQAKYITPAMFSEVYSKIANGTDRWNALEVPEGDRFAWSDSNTYIHNPPFFSKMTLDLPKTSDIVKAHVLLSVGDSFTTDHISPAGVITKGSPAARYLESIGVEQKDWNTYGSRRGNDEIMARGTFANVRIINKLASSTGPKTVHIPSGEELAIYDAAERYAQEGTPIIVLGGKEYGTGSSRDWAAKGPFLQGVKSVIAESFERIHRSNLVGMGILPLQYAEGQSAESLGLTGHELFNIPMNKLEPFAEVEVSTDCGKKFTVKARLDTDVEVEYFKHGGILNYVLRRLVSN